MRQHKINTEETYEYAALEFILISFYPYLTITEDIESFESEELTWIVNGKFTSSTTIYIN